MRIEVMMLKKLLARFLRILYPWKRRGSGMEGQKIPSSWPAEYIYKHHAFSSQLHPALLEGFLSTGKGEDVELISPLIERGEVHPDLRLEKITAHLKYRGPKPHPLAHAKYGKRAQYGVFARRDIGEGVDLGEYVGEQYVTGQSWKDQLKDCDHAWTLDCGPFVLIVNAKKYANELAFVNDYRGLGASPNVKAKWVVHKGCYHLVFETVRLIKKGEELLLDYGAGYWKSSTRQSAIRY